jgi:hypothetical protein
MKKAMLIVKRRSIPMLVSVVEYDERTGRKGKVLASEPIKNDFGNEDLVAAARSLVPQVANYEVILPIGVELA